jgi:hypothetical protein
VRTHAAANAKVRARSAPKPTAAISPASGRHLAAVNGAFDFSGPLEFVRNAAGLSDKVKQSP